jgi:hypothetical protein
MQRGLRLCVSVVEPGKREKEGRDGEREGPGWSEYFKWRSVRITQADFGHARESGWMHCGKRKDSAMRCVLKNGVQGRTMA